MWAQEESWTGEKGGGRIACRLKMKRRSTKKVSFSLNYVGGEDLDCQGKHWKDQQYEKGLKRGSDIDRGREGGLAFQREQLRKRTEARRREKKEPGRKKGKENPGVVHSTVRVERGWNDAQGMGGRVTCSGRGGGSSPQRGPVLDRDARLFLLGKKGRGEGTRSPVVGEDDPARLGGEVSADIGNGKALLPSCGKRGGDWICRGGEGKHAVVTCLGVHLTLILGSRKRRNCSFREEQRVVFGQEGGG